MRVSGTRLCSVINFTAIYFECKRPTCCLAVALCSERVSSLFFFFMHFLLCPFTFAHSICVHSAIHNAAFPCVWIECASVSAIVGVDSNTVGPWLNHQMAPRTALTFPSHVKSRFPFSNEMRVNVVVFIRMFAHGEIGRCRSTRTPSNGTVNARPRPGSWSVHFARLDGFHANAAPGEVNVSWLWARRPPNGTCERWANVAQLECVVVAHFMSGKWTNATEKSNKYTKIVKLRGLFWRVVLGII